MIVQSLYMCFIGPKGSDNSHGGMSILVFLRQDILIPIPPPRKIRSHRPIQITVTLLLWLYCRLSLIQVIFLFHFFHRLVLSISLFMFCGTYASFYCSPASPKLVSSLVGLSVHPLLFYIIHGVPGLTQPLKCYLHPIKAQSLLLCFSRDAFAFLFAVAAPSSFPFAALHNALLRFVRSARWPLCAPLRPTSSM